MKKLPLSLGVLSWKGYSSLLHTLTSYEKNGLNKLVDKKYIFLPEYSQLGIDISKKFGYKAILNNNNVGILNGFKELAKNMPAGPILLLENDLPVIEQEKNIYFQLKESIKMLNKGNIAQIRLRSVKNPGEPFHAISKYKNYWSNRFLSKFKRFFRPFKAKKLISTSIYCEENPHYKHEQYIKKLPNGFYKVSTDVINWSNLAMLVDKNFFLDVIIKEAENTRSKRNLNGFKNIEIELNKSWWRKKDWYVVLTPGLFTHKRLNDRGY